MLNTSPIFGLGIAATIVYRIPYEGLLVITKRINHLKNKIMRVKALISIILMLVSSHAFGQAMSEPFKKANTIIIETELPPSDCFTKWGRHLAQNGYSIESSDSNFLNMTTGPKNTSRFNYDFIVISSINDSGTIQIKIKWRLNSSFFAGTPETNFYDWEYASGKGNVQNIIYNDLMKTIKSFGTYSIKFEKN